MTKLMFEETLQVGEAVSHRGVVIAPLFPRLTPRAEYLTLDQAVPLGFRVTEVDAHGSVPELRVVNPLDKNVLLYDGEELVGAKQNRILNVTVLVPARSETLIPVSCVEEGRWHARSVAFAPSRAAYADLRRTKAEALSSAPLARGVAQHAVWESVRDKEARHGRFSPTHAHDELYRSREQELAALRRAFPLQAGQSGAAFALGERICLDYVSRPDAFERLYAKLLDGYLLDALEQLDQKPADEDTVRRFVAAVGEAPRSHGPSAGLGHDLRLRADGVVGSGLELDGELVQLCAFTTEGDGARTRVARPSRRR